MSRIHDLLKFMILCFNKKPDTVQFICSVTSLDKLFRSEYEYFYITAIWWQNNMKYDKGKIRNMASTDGVLQLSEFCLNFTPTYAPARSCLTCWISSGRDSVMEQLPAHHSNKQTKHCNFFTSLIISKKFSCPVLYMMS